MVEQQAGSMSMEELSRTNPWRNLSPVVMQILSLFFAREDRDLGKAVNQVHTEFSAEKCRAIAESLIRDSDVLAVLLLQSGAVTLTAGSESPLEDLFRHPEFLGLEPMVVHLHPDDAFDAGDSFDLQRILRLFFCDARENLPNAVGMFRPDLSQADVAQVVRAMHETPAVRRIFQLRRGAK